ncbi:MAG: LacI family DNA-binding transcriptional regulator [Planctomycetes bacterium]|nr:LacI family DNA-binding transcriptional regulator [Planctomycetota bacterium]
MRIKTPSRAPGPSIETVAHKAGVSVATVSRAFHESEKLALATRARVLTVARSMGYYPRVVPNKRNKVAVVTDPEASLAADSYVAQLAGTLMERLSEKGFRVLFERACNATELNASVEEGFFDALAVLGGPVHSAAWNSPTGGAGLREIARRIPVVTLNLNLGAPTWQISSDHAQGGRLAAGHLYSKGHRRVAYVAPGPETRVMLERETGFSAAAKSANAERDALVLTGADCSLVEALARVKRERCTGLVLGYQQLTLPALRTLHLLAVRVPEDLSVVGFESLNVSAYTNPPLTTVRQPLPEMGARAAETIAALLNGGNGGDAAKIVRPRKDDVFSNELVERESVRALTPAHAKGEKR